MLMNIDPLLTPELLYVLAAMGHGDELAICDVNFPAESVARTTDYGKVVRLAGVNAPRAARAILSVLPLDDFVESPVTRIEVEGSPDEFPLVQKEMQAETDRAAGRSLPMTGLERFAYYEAARHTFAVVATDERRFWGCFIFKKGVIPPSAD